MPTTVQEEPLLEKDIEAVPGVACLVQPSLASVIDGDGLLAAAMERRHPSRPTEASSEPVAAAEAEGETIELARDEPAQRRGRATMIWAAPLCCFLASLLTGSPESKGDAAREYYERGLWSRVRSREEWQTRDLMNPSRLRVELDRIRDMNIQREPSVRDVRQEAWRAAKDAKGAVLEYGIDDRFAEVEASLNQLRKEALPKLPPDFVSNIATEARKMAIYSNTANAAAAAAAATDGEGGPFAVDIDSYVAQRLEEKRSAVAGDSSFDFASTRTGGEIVAANTSQTAMLPFWQQYIFPAVAHPASIFLGGDAPVDVGRCWAFDGNEGVATIKLAAPTAPTAFAMAHAPPEAAGFGDAPSAPRNFEVVGYEDLLRGEKSYDLGTFTFDPWSSSSKSSSTIFQAQKPPEPINYVKLHITDNHGSDNYTCVYRFAVY